MNAPEIFVAEGLIPRPISRTPLEVQWTQGPERTIEGLEHKTIDYDSSSVPVNHYIMPTRRKKKRCTLMISVAIIVIVSLAGGLGKGLQKGGTCESSLLQI